MQDQPLNRHGLVFVATLLLALLLAALAPLEKTLGSNGRVVYFHGAWVWAALITFAAAAICGLFGIMIQRRYLHRWSQALGRSGITFWLIFIPISVYVMQTNWNGLFWDEPRFRIPLNFAVIGLLLQIGVSLFDNPIWSSIVNIGFALALFISIRSAPYVLHPASPILNSNSQKIQLFFLILFLLLMTSCWQLASWYHTLHPGQHSSEDSH
jgi:hypothetical protein